MDIRPKALATGFICLSWAVSSDGCGELRSSQWTAHRVDRCRDVDVGVGVNASHHGVGFCQHGHVISLEDLEG
jgi:hypothetical protein